MMKHAKQQKKIVQSVVAALAVLGAGSATAAGFQLLEQNGSGLGNAYAGSAATAENASTIFYNPAGMTQLKGLQVSGGAAIVQASYKFQDNWISAQAHSPARAMAPTVARRGEFPTSICHPNWVMASMAALA